MTATGVWWNSHGAALGLADLRGHERCQALAPGGVYGWRVHGPRRCIGVWIPATATRTPCPTRSLVTGTGRSGQCRTCQDLDPGRMLARDGVVDDRSYGVYLAWFGPALIKIGITAAERGHNRLAEQGALLFTWLARGRLSAARRIEITAVAGGQVRDRFTRRVKHSGWPQAGDTARAVDELTRVHANLAPPSDASADPAAGPWPLPLQVHDLRPRYRLGSDTVLPTRELTGVIDGSLITGRLDALIGTDAVMTITGRPVLAPLPVLTGWGLTRARGEDEAADLTTQTRPDAARGDDEHPTLF